MGMLRFLAVFAFLWPAAAEQTAALKAVAAEQPKALTAEQKLELRNLQHKVSTLRDQIVALENQMQGVNQALSRKLTELVPAGWGLDDEHLEFRKLPETKQAPPPKN